MWAICASLSFASWADAVPDISNTVANAVVNLCSIIVLLRAWVCEQSACEQTVRCRARSKVPGSAAGLDPGDDVFGHALAAAPAERVGVGQERAELVLEVAP